MIIRPFGGADYGAVCRVVAVVQPDAPWAAAQLHEADRNRARHLKSGGFLAETRGQAVGFVRYTQYADYYQPEKVVLSGGVLPEFRGAGIGGRPSCISAAL